VDSKSRMTLTHIRHFLNSRISALKKFMYLYIQNTGKFIAHSIFNISVVDPHQSDKLDPDPHQFADDNSKCMEYEPI
jgi:hypothetical protein